MVYNLTGIGENSTTLLGFTQAVNNTLMFGWLGTMFLLIIFSVSFMSFMLGTGSSKKALATSCFVTAGCALLLLFTSLIPGKIFFITTILAAAGIAISWKTD